MEKTAHHPFTILQKFEKTQKYTANDLRVDWESFDKPCWTSSALDEAWRRKL